MTTSLSHNRYILGNSRILQLSNETPLQINEVQAPEDGPVTIKLSGYNAMTRCHVICTSLLPVFTPYQSLCAPTRYPDVIDFETISNSQYAPTTKCDEEFMYILNRSKKSTVKYNGNLLYKPSLILGKYAPPQMTSKVVSEPSPRAMNRIQAVFGKRYNNNLEAAFKSEALKCEDSASVEFLPQPSMVFTNLRPDENGVVTVPHFKKNEFRCVQVIAADDENTALMNHVLGGGAVVGPDMATNDVRLAPGFEPTKHYSPCRKIQCLEQVPCFVVVTLKQCF